MCEGVQEEVKEVGDTTCNWKFGAGGKKNGEVAGRCICCFGWFWMLTAVKKSYTEKNYGKKWEFYQKNIVYHKFCPPCTHANFVPCASFFWNCTYTLLKVREIVHFTYLPERFHSREYDRVPQSMLKEACLASPTHLALPATGIHLLLRHTHVPRQVSRFASCFLTCSRCFV